MKILPVILCAILFVSCTNTTPNEGVKVSSINADISKISDDIVVFDNFYPDSDEKNAKKLSNAERKKYMKTLIPQGITVSTTHFHFTSDMSHDFTKTWASYIDSAFSELSKLLEPTIKEKSSIFVFRNRERYRDYARILAPENINSRGYYDPKFRLIVSYYENNPEKLKRTLLHECTHVMLRNYIGHNCIPPWIDEGLACTYETGNYVNGRWEFGLPRLNFVRHLKGFMKTNKFNPFRKIMSIGWRKFIDGSMRNVEINYLISWSLVYYFIYYKNGINKKLLIDFLHKIRDVQEPEMKYSFIYDNIIKPNEKEFLRTWQEFLYSMN